MEYKQNEYSFSRCSSAFFLGIVFVLVPVSLSADLVYDREVIFLFTIFFVICSTVNKYINIYLILKLFLYFID